jgi:Regulator of chromosome condensation (RCC1) repeat
MGCALNSDCATGLICTFGLCHGACVINAPNGDCPAPELCVKSNASGDAGSADAGTINVCQLPVELTCVYNSQCMSPLVCARDEQCRNQCQTSVDCVTGQVCTDSKVCALPSQLVKGTNDVMVVTSGLDAGAAGSGAPGTGGAGGGTGTGGGVGTGGAAGGSSTGTGGAAGAAGAAGKGGTTGTGGGSGGCSPACGVGYQCVSGACQACGASAQVCCGSVCNANLTCVSGMCSCGAVTEMCCGGTQCNSGLSCVNMTCSCGAAGQNCCATSPKCTGSLVCGGLKCGCTIACDEDAAMKYDGSIYVTGTPVANIDNSNFIAKTFSWNGTFGCAVKSDGTVWCWGSNYYGSLGAGLSNTDLASSKNPVQVILGNAGSAGGTPLSGVTAISVGDYSSYSACAVGTGGAVYCWGYGTSGQLGNNAKNNSTFAIQVQNMDGSSFMGATQVSLSSVHACALHADTGGGNSAWCWGDNTYGQIGIGSTATTIPYAAQVTKLASNVAGVVAASPGGYVSCAAINDGSAWCWGNDTYADLGDGNYTGMAAVPTQVKTAAATYLGSVTQVIDWEGQDKMCALKSDGTIWCWGGGGSATYAYAAPLTDSTQAAVTGITTVGRECYLDTDDQVWYNGSDYASYQVPCP